MKILILSPLFPPDTGAPALYVKELASRLQATAKTTLLVYGHLPEAVPGATICSVDKRAILPIRIAHFTKALLTEEQPDLMVVNNAPSTELPLFLVSLFRKTRFVLLLSDVRATKASQHGFYRILHAVIKKRATKIIQLPDESIYQKMEKLPFAEFDVQREADRNVWWEAHLKQFLL